MYTLNLWSAIAYRAGDAYHVKARPHYDNRPYHNWSHIHEMLGFIRSLNLPEEDGIIAHYVAYYHDAVYVPGSQTNEEESAELFLADHPCQNDMTEERRQRIANLIRATKTHELTDDPLSAVIMDADMFILAAPEWRYAQYLAGIREEYKQFTDDQWREGRRKFIESVFNEPGPTFYIPDVEKVFGPIMDNNLRREYATLFERRES